MRLKKIEAENWEAGTYAKYQVIGNEGIQLSKDRESYHYNGRDGWGHYGVRDVWRSEGDYIARGRTRKELMEKIQRHLEWEEKA